MQQVFGDGDGRVVPIDLRGDFGAVAQLVERLHGMEEARGSIPLSSTVSSEAAYLGWFTLGAWHAR